MTQDELRGLFDLLLDLEDQQKEMAGQIKHTREQAAMWSNKPIMEVGDCERFARLASVAEGLADRLESEKFSLGLRINNIKRELIKTLL
jgi:hypothetical protein